LLKTLFKIAASWLNRATETKRRRQSESLDFDPRWYYERLSEFWMQQDKAFWNSVRTFLISESILMAAVGVVLSQGDVHSVWPFIVVLAIGGAAVSCQWSRVANRLTDALHLTSHQARHLELEIFAERSPGTAGVGQKLPSFPMFFWGSYAVMRNLCEETKDLPPEELRKMDLTPELRAIMCGNRTHHTDQQKMLVATGFSAYSSVSTRLPRIFLISWFLVIVATILSLFCDTLSGPDLALAFLLLVLIAVLAFVALDP